MAKEPIQINATEEAQAKLREPFKMQTITKKNQYSRSKKKKKSFD